MTMMIVSNIFNTIRKISIKLSRTNAELFQIKVDQYVICTAVRVFNQTKYTQAVFIKLLKSFSDCFLQPSYIGLKF